MDKQVLEIYSDYLISSFSYTTATGLSRLTDGLLSHDKVTRFLSNREYDSKDLWLMVKPMVRKVEREDGVIILDDTVEEKQYTDENDIIAYHFDHSIGRSVKGINMLSVLYNAREITIPLSFEVVKKTEIVKDKKTGKDKRISKDTKNKIARNMIMSCHNNQIKYQYVLGDIFFSSKENMEFIKQTLKKDFIFAVKGNRLVALSVEDKLKGIFKRVEEIELKADTCCLVYFKGISFPTMITKQVFTNKDESQGILYLACSDANIDYSTFTSTYQKRWNIEEYHKSIKSNTGFSKSPTRRVITQNNHFFASIYAYFKLELLKLKTSLNHFAMKSQLYMRALTASYQTLRELRKINGLCVT